MPVPTPIPVQPSPMAIASAAPTEGVPAASIVDTAQQSEATATPDENAVDSPRLAVAPELAVEPGLATIPEQSPESPTDPAGASGPMGSGGGAGPSGEPGPTDPDAPAGATANPYGQVTRTPEEEVSGATSMELPDSPPGIREDRVSPRRRETGSPWRVAQGIAAALLLLFAGGLFRQVWRGRRSQAESREPIGPSPRL